MKCLNCGTDFESPFCPNCGQKREIKPYSLSNIVLNELPKVIFNTEKGFLKNIKNLALRPKAFIEDYLQGKRANAFKPLQFVVVCVTILTIVDSQLASINFEFDASRYEKTEYYGWGMTYGSFLRHNIRLLWILMIVFCAIPNSLIFSRFNFAEHIIINSFVLGQACIYTSLLYFLYPLRLVFNPIMFFSLLLMFSLVFYRKVDGWIPSILICFGGLFTGYILFFLLPATVIYLTS